MGPVDRLEPTVGKEQPRAFSRACLGHFLEAEGKGHHLGGAEFLHAGRHMARVRRADRAGRQHLAGQPAIGPAALRRDEDVRAPGRSRDLRTQAPAPLRRPGQGAMRGQVVRVQPIGIHLGQPAAQLGQLCQQGRITAAMGRRRAQGQHLPLGNQEAELGREAAARGSPQVDLLRAQGACPLQQMGAFAVADQDQPHASAPGSSPAQAR